MTTHGLKLSLTGDGFFSAGCAALQHSISCTCTAHSCVGNRELQIPPPPPVDALHQQGCCRGYFLLSLSTGATSSFIQVNVHAVDGLIQSVRVLQTVQPTAASERALTLEGLQQQVSNGH